MRTNTIPAVGLQFKCCKSGMIDFTVRADTKSVNVSALDHNDPFPSLVRWLEAILTGVDFCAFSVDEDSTAKRFEARHYYNGVLCFNITDYETELLKIEVSSQQLVTTFYRDLRNFAKSPLYIANKTNWETATFGDRLARLLPGLNEAQIIEHCSFLNRLALDKLFFEAVPGWRELHRGATEDSPVPKDFDEWWGDQKAKYVVTKLVRMPVNHRMGRKLGDLYSAVIEQYLAYPTSDEEEFMACDDSTITPYKASCR